MFCGNCGNKLNNGAKFCPSCGSPVQNSKVGTNAQVNNTSNNNQVVGDKVNVLFVISSFLVPILGLIFFARDKDKNPKNAKACGIAGIAGFALNIVIMVISFILGFVAAFNEVELDNTNRQNSTTSKPTTKVQYDRTTKYIEERPNEQDRPNTQDVSVDWKKYTVSVNNKTISLPCSYSEFSNITGYTMKDDLLNENLPKNRYGVANMYKDNKLAIYTDVINTVDADTLYKDAYIANVSQTKFQVETNKADKFIFPGNLSVGHAITEDELKVLFGEPTKRNEYKGEKYTKVTYIYAEDEKWTTVDKYEIELKDGIIDELRLDHKGA